MNGATPNLISETIRVLLVTMFFLGHMCWGYIFGKATSYLTSSKIQIQLALLCGILPDIDLLLNIEHGGMTHSIFFWIVIFVPITLWVGPKRSLPYLFSTLQHPLFGDFISASYKILIPFNDIGYGFNLGVLSSISLSFELLGFLAFIVLAYLSKELAQLFFSNSKNLLSLLPSAAMLVSYEIALGIEGWSYVTLSFKSAQVIFLLLLISSSFMGVVGWISKIGNRHKQASTTSS